jgi:hypothetical protein
MAPPLNPASRPGTLLALKPGESFTDRTVVPEMDLLVPAGKKLAHLWHGAIARASNHCSRRKYRANVSHAHIKGTDTFEARLTITSLS